MIIVRLFLFANIPQQPARIRARSRMVVSRLLCFLLRFIHRDRNAMCGTFLLVV